MVGPVEDQVSLENALTDLDPLLTPSGVPKRVGELVQCVERVGVVEPQAGLVSRAREFQLGNGLIVQAQGEVSVTDRGLEPRRTTGAMLGSSLSLAAALSRTSASLTRRPSTFGSGFLKISTR